MTFPKDLKIIDAHHHLWDLDAVDYPWLNARGVERFFGDPTPIQKNYYPNDLRSDASPAQIEKSVHIQVGATNSTDESNWIQSITDTLPNAHIAEAKLQDSNIVQTLKDMKQLSKIKGVRQIIGRHPIEDAKTGTDDLLDDPKWLQGLAALEGANLSFDLQLIAGQYERAINALNTVPNLPAAICHFGSPWDMSHSAFNHWQDCMTRFAKLPNVMIKLSGFSMFKPDWASNDIERYIIAALDIFGPKRCMYGSNFPVDGLHRSYNEILDATYDLVTSWDKAAVQPVFANNALSFYKL